MTDEGRLKNLFYIFSQTVLSQLAVDITFALLMYVSYVAVELNSGILFIVGAAAFLAMLFFYLCVYLYHKSYGVRIFKDSKSEFNSDDYVGREYQHVEYQIGRKNTLTGQRSINTRTVTRRRSSVLIAAFVYSIYIGLFGVIQFAIEIAKALSSESRMAAWQDARGAMFDAMEDEGKLSFFKVPLVSFAIILLAVVVSFPVQVVDNIKYSPGNIKFTITEKENYGNRARPEIAFEGVVTKKSSAEITAVRAVFIFSDSKGNLLKEHEVSVRGFSDPANADGFEFNFGIILDPDDDNDVRLWNCELDDIKISVIFKEIKYKDRGSVSSDKEYTVKK